MTSSLLNNISFTDRHCPFCGEQRSNILFNLKASQFCSVNWSYSQDYPELLGISEEAEFPVNQCLSCGFIYARFLPAHDFLATVYDRVILYDKCLQGSENPISYTRRLEYIATLIGLAPASKPLRALDYGCGLGVSLRILQAASIETVGFDNSPLRSQTIKDWGIIVDNEKQIQNYSPFEIIVCDNVLEHLADPAGTLDFLASVCSPEAVIYVSVPSYEPRMVKKQLTALSTQQDLDMTLNPWEHLNYFTLEHLDRMMNRAGFIPIEATQLPSAPNIGLRPELHTMARLKNSLASAVRLIRYALKGRIERTVEHTFYRFIG